MNIKQQFTTVTRFSKIMALLIFVSFPFIGFCLGIQYDQAINSLSLSSMPDVTVSKGLQKPVACTLEAKICPDGSSVGRTGSNCEFAACPIAQDQIAGWKTYVNDEFTFQYPSKFIANQQLYKMVYFGEKEGGSSLMEVDYWHRNGAEEMKTNFEEYAIKELETYCMADRPGASTRCDRVVSSKVFNNENDVNFLEIYLNQNESDEKGTKNVTVGPFYVTNDSAQNENAGGIFFTPKGIDSKTMSRIISTFKFTK